MKQKQKMPPVFIQEYLYADDIQYQYQPPREKKESDEDRGVLEIDLDNASIIKIQIG
jgi:hypothetical protein